jgi:hypothetical protein
MLLILITDVNFTNILGTAFWYERFLLNISVLSVCVSIFWQDEIIRKAAFKMVVILTPGVKFTNIL